MMGPEAMVYSHRRNLNRGYMKLEVWNDAIELFALVHKILDGAHNLDLRLKGQILDAAQSVSANIAEGYGRKSINEYLYFLNVALGSSAELMTRMIGLKSVQQVSEVSFSAFDESHYRMENKLLALTKSLQAKRRMGSWDSEIHDRRQPYVH